MGVAAMNSGGISIITYSQNIGMTLYVCSTADYWLKYTLLLSIIYNAYKSTVFVLSTCFRLIIHASIKQVKAIHNR